MNIRIIFLSLVLALALAACGAPDAANTEADAQEHAGAEAGHEAGGDDDHDDHDDGEGGDARITLTDAQVQAAGIELLTAAPAEIRETLPLYGVLAPNAERVRDVAARFPGVIRSVAKTVGDSVRAGETLATVEANESLQTYAVTAPLAGVVTARNANPGEQTGEKTLFTVADLATVWVELSLFPRDASRVKVGQTVRVKGTDAGLEADGRLVWVAPFGQAANQTQTARVLLDNAGRRWAPGLYVTAEVTLATAQVPLAVHADAVQTLEAGRVVFVREGEAFEPRAVVLGRSDGRYAEVVSGLAAGEAYAAAGSFILKADLGKGSAEDAD